MQQNHMRHRFRVLIQAGLLAGVLCAPAARATDVTVQQADALQQRLRDWLAANLGQAVLASGQQPEVRADGDHFAVAIPLQLPGPPAASRTIVLANARQTSGGPWDIDTVPSNLPISFTIDTPVPNEDGKKGPPRSVPVTYAITTAKPSAHARFDPSFATPSTMTASNAGMTVTTRGGPVSSTTTAGPANTLSTIQPAGPGLINVSSDTSVQQYRTVVQAPGLAPVASATEKLQLSLRMTCVNRDRAAEITRALTAMASAGLPDGSPGMSKAASDLLAVIAANLQGLAASAAMDQTAEGFELSFGGITAKADEFGAGFDASADAGLLRASMGIKLRGVALANAPLGPFEALVPQGLAFRLVVSGLKTPELQRALTAISRDQRLSAGDTAGLADGATAGIESLELEVGGATFSGEGHTSITAPGHYIALATLSAENFDGLIQTVNAVPLLQQAIPALAFLKGFGRSADGRIVWTIRADGAKVLVNDIDISAMANAMKPSPPRPGPTRTPRPRHD